MAPEGNVLTFAWLALPNFMILPFPKFASISPKTRSRAFFFASLFAAVVASEAEKDVAAALALDVAGFPITAEGFAAGLGFAPDALGAFAAAAEEEENDALCADCASRRDARDPPPFADAENPDPTPEEVSSAEARTRTATRGWPSADAAAGVTAR
jgi:hypothetical protein